MIITILHTGNGEGDKWRPTGGGRVCWELLRPCWQWCANRYNNSKQCWDLQCTVGRVWPIRLWRQCVMRVRAQRQLCHLTFVGARNLSNHALAWSKPLFANLKILDVFSIYSLQVSSFMYLYHNDALPISFNQIFQTGNQIHQYSTRYSDF